jgi:hypothetical protein
VEHGAYRPQRRTEAGQGGIWDLLTGSADAIKPEGFDTLHQRHGMLHRLNDNVQKWMRHREPEHANGNGHSNGNGFEP